MQVLNIPTDISPLLVRNLTPVLFLVTSALAQMLSVEIIKADILAVKKRLVDAHVIKHHLLHV